MEKKKSSSKRNNIFKIILLVVGLMMIVALVFFLTGKKEAKDSIASGEYGEFFYTYSDVTSVGQVAIGKGTEKEVHDQKSGRGVYDFSLEKDLLSKENVAQIVLETEDWNIDLKEVYVSLSKLEDGTEKEVVKPQRFDQFATLNQGKKIYQEKLNSKGTTHYRLRVWSSSVDDARLRANVAVYLGTGEKIPALHQDSVAYQVFSDRGEKCALVYQTTGVYLRGNCQKNYLNYQGIVFRPYMIDSRGNSMKVITEQVLTALSYQEKKNAVYSESYVDHWLETEFLSLFPETDPYLTELYVDVTQVLNPNEPTSSRFVKKNVGLMSLTDYKQTLPKSKREDWYLGNESQWWLSNVKTNNSVYQVNRHDRVSTTTPTLTSGVRPVLAFSGNTPKTSGEGSQSAPYQIGKRENRVGELLSTAHAGEYLMFDGKLYQISRFENGYTKVISNSAITDLGKIAFSEEEADSNFSSTKGIGLALQNWYEKLGEKRQMIAPNQQWYDRCDDWNHCQEKRLIQATIGLPSYGEMFTGKAIRLEKEPVEDLRYWTMSLVTDRDAYYYTIYGQVEKVKTIKKMSVRPMFYFEKEVRIVSGAGTIQNPYQIA